MLGWVARGAFLFLLAVMVASWAVSLAEQSKAEPQYDPTVQWLA